MDGLCDVVRLGSYLFVVQNSAPQIVEGCNRATYISWRPLTERRGRQICKYHWNRYKDKKERKNIITTSAQK